MHQRLIVLLSSVLLCAAAPLSAASWKEQQIAAAEKSESILRQTEKVRGLLAQYQIMRAAYAADESKAFRLIFGQYLSWHQSYLGLHEDALQSFSIQQISDKQDAPSPLEGDWQLQPAVDVIARLAQGQRAVFFNEAHNAAITRSLTVEMLPRLKALGFTHFAAETLYETDHKLAQRGYANDDSGFYTQEPVYAEMVRTALKLGFIVVPYEAASDATGDAREREQARNLYQRVFKDNADARLVVNAGYAHIVESGKYLGGASMAQHFRKMTRIDPLTIEQTMLIPHTQLGQDHAYYRALLAKSPPKQPGVFVAADGKPWTLRPDQYDLSVVLPPFTRENGRESWLSLDGARVPYSVDGEICRNSMPCLLEARYQGDGDDAIPADRIVIGLRDNSLSNTEQKFRTIDQLRTDLYLRPGKYRLRATNADNQVVTTQNITVGNRDRNP
ncbi:hypothetical protein DFR29_107244 [Tahibacter aquaticus]|jgi:hypothetical protein|uniref:Polysaccharide deacetylase n=1 Tax=Tahibacter aquaticus TaxID=520092 RepID=A0A4R6YWR7_9GAMM|nr:hypothetical protein [Tahibacter aquaticus]TDR43231.1 hypothetical protein DFR29_107244 [Tahibacter aquaticus]